MLTLNLDELIIGELSKEHVYLAMALMGEKDRQKNNIELIASENFCSEAVKLAMASCLTNKYAEGYPDMDRSGNSGRYYGGCHWVDRIEQHCCDVWQDVFHTDYHVNVQPHSGSQANAAAYMALIKPGDTVLSLELNNGGHLTHGSKVNFSGKTYNFVHYGVDANGYIDYKDLRAKILEYAPDLVLVGASAYPREINFMEIRELIDSTCKMNYINKYIPMMVDMAHIAGLIAANEHPSPFGIADIITTTTHKTLRGPRGGLIFCKPEYAKKVDSAIFPGNQGGPLEHIILAKAICAEEALSNEYKEYIKQVKKNCAAMANRFKELGFELVTGGTDNHLLLIDFTNTHPNLTGQDAQDVLDEQSITLNKNCVPNEKRSPKLTSGVRIGTAPMTTKGWKEEDFINCANEISNILNHVKKEG